MLANHGSERKYEHDVSASTRGSTPIQAVVLRPSSVGWTTGTPHGVRRRTATRELLGSVEGVRPPSTMSGNEHVWHLYVARVADRDEVLAELNAAGIGAALHYPYPVHLTKAFAGLGQGAGAFPVSERAATEILSIPMFPHLLPDMQERVASALITAVR